MPDKIDENPLEFYDSLLRGPLTKIYSAKRLTNLPDFLNYSNLIIDKFAIHSASFYFLSEGIIEVKKSGETVRMSGYDLFSVNSLFRNLMETYSIFNHLFVEPTTIEEKKFRFLLWKADGIADKKGFDITADVALKMQHVLENDKVILEKTIAEIKKCSFYSKLPSSQLAKIFDPVKNKFIWRFLISDTYEVTPLKITALIKHTCKTTAFTNTHKYTSLHTHTNFLSIEHFKQSRGQIISKESTDPLTRLAIYLTALLIFDICSIDENAKNELDKQPVEIKDFIIGIAKAIKSS